MPRSIRVDEDLWAAVVAPEGTLEWWFRSEGERVAVGDKLAEVMIEGARHEVVSPRSGCLNMLMLTGSVLDPGCVIGQIE